jgi:hypothetical protein
LLSFVRFERIEFGTLSIGSVPLVSETLASTEELVTEAAVKKGRLAVGSQP